jgi:hypothetical protein
MNILSIDFFCPQSGKQGKMGNSLAYVLLLS